MEVEQVPSDLPPLVEDESSVEKKLPHLSLFPLSEKGEALEDEWPSLPARQEMSPLPSLPLSGAKNGGGWMELFANNDENPPPRLAMGLAPSSQRPSSIKRTQPSPHVAQHNRERKVLPVLFAEMGNKISEKTSPPSPVVEKISLPERKINEQKSKQDHRNTLKNPFAVLEDLEEKDPQGVLDDLEEKDDPEGAEAGSTSPHKIKRKKRRRSTNVERMDQKQGTKSCFLFVSSMIYIVSFLLFILTSLR